MIYDGWNNGKQKRSRTKAAWRQLENVSAIGLLWKEFVSEREELQITLENKGFAELTEEADCYLELERNGTLQKKIQIATDARLWKSGEKTTLCQKIKLPAELAEPEEQKLYLALYRRRDGRTISFANQGEKQGRPFLGIFKIDPIVLI